MLEYTCVCACSSLARKEDSVGLHIVEKHVVRVWFRKRAYASVCLRMRRYEACMVEYVEQKRMRLHIGGGYV